MLVLCDNKQKHSANTQPYDQYMHDINLVELTYAVKQNKKLWEEVMILSYLCEYYASNF